MTYLGYSVANKSLQDQGLVIGCPKKMVADDGRVFHIRIWTPTISCDGLVSVCCEILPTEDEKKSIAPVTREATSEPLE